MRVVDHEQYQRLCIEMRKQVGGILEIKPKFYIRTVDDLATIYTPGVAEPCRRIAENPELAYTYTGKANTIAVISDGTAVLGLGDIGPMAGLPVMEGKAALFKQFAGIDAVPIVVGSTDVDKLEMFVRMIAPTFGGINLEDISAPHCIELVERLRDLEIPLFHDDQDGTAVVTTAALKNALALTGRTFADATIVINGAGAAGYAIAKMLSRQTPRPKRILILDSKGIIHREAGKPLHFHKELMLKMPGVEEGKGSLADAMRGADVFIGVSKARLVTPEMVRSMAPDPIVFAMANPDPEIMPGLAYEAGAAIVGSGRSDYPNQINNVLAFPGIFRGTLDVRARRITPRMLDAAATALANVLRHPTRDKILPKTLDRCVSGKIADAVAEAWTEEMGLPAPPKHHGAAHDPRANRN
ncbi:MAG: NADP-dependent malic enzyme [Myxococcales bacterium]|nr:MAG: NADP-dependent malic enzyme [Myxococcales bacterium]